MAAKLKRSKFSVASSIEKEGRKCASMGREDFSEEQGLTLGQCSLQETVVKEKWKLCEEKNQDPQAKLGRWLFLQSKERRHSRICEPLSKLAIGRRMPDRVTGAWPCKPPDGAGLLDKSVKSVLESTVEALESDVAGSVFEQSLWLPCMEDVGEFDKEPTKCYSDCKDSQKEFSSFSDQKLDLHLQTNREPDSDILNKEPSVDLSQNEDTASFTAHPDDFNSHYHEIAAERSNCEEGFIADYHPSLGTKDNLPPNEIPQETCSVKRTDTCLNKEESREDHGIEFDQSPGPSFTTAGRENDKGTVASKSLVCELQDEVAFYQDQCRELREELVKLKEKWNLCEEEKQHLQAEVGRQLFLESRERQCSKIYKPCSEHVRGTSMPGKVRGLLLQQRLQEISNSLSELDLNQIKHLVQHKFNGFRLARIKEGSELFEELEREGEFSCSFVRDLLERIHRFDLAEKLAVPFQNGEKSYGRESCSLQGSKQLDEVSESVSGVDGKQSDEVEERKGFDNSEADREVQFCNNSNKHPLNSCSEVAADTFHAEIGNESSFAGNVDLSKEKFDSASSLSQSFDVPSIGMESKERSPSPSVTGEQFDSGELKGACGAGDNRGKEGSYESSPHDGAEGQLNFNNHFNDTEDGTVNLPDRAQDRLMPEDFTGVNQDSLPCGDKTQSQNVLSARITARKDRAVDQSDSHVGNQSNKWEHKEARPRDRPPKTDRSPEPSLLYLLENLVSPQVAGPVGHGVANAFLARHSEDKNLHESLHYTNAENMFTENPPLQGASHVDGMMNLMGPNKAELHCGDCQFASRQDSYHQPHSSLFSLTGGAYIGGNNGSNTDFNLLKPNIANNFAPCTRIQDGTFPYLQRNELLHSGFTGSGLTSDFMQTTGSQTGAFNLSNSSFSMNDYALGIREPQIPPDRHFTSLQINQPIHSGFNGSGFSFDLTGTTRREMTHSATDNHRNSDFSGIASMLPSTTNPRLLGTSSVNIQTYDYHTNASQTASSGARAHGSDSKLSAGLESSRSSQLLPVTTGRDVLNTSGQGNSSSNAMNTSCDRLASAHYREGSRAHNSSSSELISGINTGGSLNQQPGQTGDSVTNKNYGTESVESTDNSLLELEGRVEEACAMVERVLRKREGREEFGREIERKEREIRAERARKKREKGARELEEASYGGHEQEERESGAEGGLQTTYGPCVVESLNSTHNSPQAWLEGIEAAKAKVCFQARLH